MNCPACRSSLMERHVSDVKLDVCEEGCAGIWFDGSQIRKFDALQDPDAETILNLQPTIGVAVQKEPHHCPKCRTLNLEPLDHSKAKKKIVIEECTKCRGVFFNAQVLNQIRRENPTETSRKLAAAKLFEETFGPTKAAGEEVTDRLHRYGEAVKFLCPSFYLSADADRDAL